MKILIDMNLSPEWIGYFKKVHLEALHWSTVGNPRAKDSEIFQWARLNKYIVFTHYLDFGSILAAFQRKSPSVIQVCTKDVTPNAIGKSVVSVLKKFCSQLEQGVLISVDENKARIRMLPINWEKN